MKDLSCGEALPYLLRGHGVDTVFGMPGVHTLELYKTLAPAGLRHIGVRHEQGAGFMADGYARASGRPGVCLLISGPGLTNAATPIGQAYTDSIPLLVLSAMNARANIGLDRGTLHEITDQPATAAPLAGTSAAAWEASQVPVHLDRAFAGFGAARPRPVVLSLPLDVLAGAMGEVGASGQMPARPGPSATAVTAAAALLRAAEQPMILAGGGTIDAAGPLLELAEKIGALVVTTIAAKGVMPDSHRLSLGASLQRIATRRAIQRADLVLAVGTEISEPDLYLSSSADDDGIGITADRLDMSGKLIRIDIEAAATVRDYPADVAMVADAAAALVALRAALAGDRCNSDQTAEAMRIRAANHASMNALSVKHMSALEALRQALPADGLVYADMCQIAYTGCVFFPTEEPRCWHFPNGYGTLGYALPAAIGGKLACPDRATAVLVGDGGIMFTIAELATAVELKLPIVIILWDNNALGEIRDGMRARQIPEIAVTPLNPDFEGLVKSFGASYLAPDDLSAIGPALEAGFAADGPTVLHIRETD